jgi:hypothetical protein
MDVSLEVEGDVGNVRRLGRWAACLGRCALRLRVPVESRLVGTRGSNFETGRDGHEKPRSRGEAPPCQAWRGAPTSGGLSRHCSLGSLQGGSNGAGARRRKGEICGSRADHFLSHGERRGGAID